MIIHHKEMRYFESTIDNMLCHKCNFNVGDASNHTCIVYTNLYRDQYPSKFQSGIDEIYRCPQCNSLLLIVHDSKEHSWIWSLIDVEVNTEDIATVFKDFLEETL